MAKGFNRQPAGQPGMMQQLQRLQQQMTEAQEKLATERFEASAGGGLVKAVVDGRQAVKEIKISPDALKEGDVTLLEDLILTAVAEAQRASEAAMQETMGKLTGGLGLPF